MEPNGSLTITQKDPGNGITVICEIVRFRDIRFWKTTSDGVSIYYEDHFKVIPWHMIYDLHVEYNTEEYRRFLEMEKLEAVRGTELESIVTEINQIRDRALFLYSRNKLNGGTHQREN